MANKVFGEAGGFKNHIGYYDKVDYKKTSIAYHSNRRFFM